MTPSPATVAARLPVAFVIAGAEAVAIVHVVGVAAAEAGRPTARRLVGAVPIWLVAPEARRVEARLVAVPPAVVEGAPERGPVAVARLRVDAVAALRVAVRTVFVGAAAAVDLDAEAGRPVGAVARVAALVVVDVVIGVGVGVGTVALVVLVSLHG